MRFTYALALCLLVGLSSGAIADTISYQATFPATAVGSGQVVSLSQFDPSMGQLVSVELYLEANAFAGISYWDNESQVVTFVELGIGATVTANAPDSVAIIIVPLQEGSGYAQADNEPNNEPYNTPADYLGTDCVTLSGNTGTDSDSASPTNFAPYTGTGTFDVSISGTCKTYCYTTGGEGSGKSSDGQYDGLVKVTYTYIPEPTTLGLLACGGVAILVRRKRK